MLEILWGIAKFIWGILEIIYVFFDRGSVRDHSKRANDALDKDFQAAEAGVSGTREEPV